jgi:hypothetical protein
VHRRLQSILHLASKDNKLIAGFEVLTLVTLKSIVLWVVALCSLERDDILGEHTQKVVSNMFL